MAVATIDIMPKPASSSPLSSNNPSMNKRWPPLADKTSLPYKLTTLSRQKLAREATAPDPDIRRCLGHFRLHVISMEWAQKDMTTRINSFELEDDESEEEEEDNRRDDTQDKKDCDESDTSDEAKEESKDLDTKVEDATVEKPSDKESVHLTFSVSFEQSAPAPTPSSPESDREEKGLIEKGRNCLEKTKHFWPSPPQCIPVRIAG
ncbi:hypothetical protein ETB97_002973 [Aspergillus alliaceus]|uniref:Uncharacterized protein n=1 Tax=Petromyces alliaceus TaxID=209559 RepID=A0A5N7CKS6_PETAA|nr:hypothetical protein BDV23DRAFT_11058 [Aspergillus alliaceus]KAF5859311.1 hypothetical protein ETB97_002973 [Aspergillus burnettii]